MSLTEKHLGQARENSTSAVSVYSPPASTRTVVKNITVCNTTSATATFSLYLDNDGTTYDASTAIFFGKPVYANTTLSLEVYLIMDNANGNLAYQSGTANALTITVSGAEIA